MGFFKKSLLVLAVFVAVAIALAPSPEDQTLALANELETIANAEPSGDIAPEELRQLFVLGSEFTDVQRDNKEAEITGKTAEWEGKVYEVRKRDENEYRVQTTGDASAPPTFAVVITRSPAEVQYVEGLKTGDTIQFKGIIGGTTMRHIDFDKAVLIGASAG